MSAKLNIFMVGGRRCGKTTVLSKIYNQFNTVLHHGPGEGPDLFSINLDINDIPHITSAESAVNSIFCDNGAYDVFPVEDYNPSYAMTENKFNLCPIIPGASLKVGFRDIPGEWCNGTVIGEDGQRNPNMVTAKGIDGNVETKNAIEFVVDYIRASTVTIIAIDTPAMIEEHGAFNNAINRIGPITEAFKTALGDNGGDENISDKLILFVPLKCEKYVVNKDGTIDNDGMRKVAQHVRQSYVDLIGNIGNHPVLRESVSAAILPIVTIKEVLWSSYECIWNGQDGASIFDANGRPRIFPEYYDPKNLIKPFFSFRNYTMHKNALDNGSLSEFCEQPLVYSLVYSMNLYLYRKQNPAKVAHKGLFGAILAMFVKISNFLKKNRGALFGLFNGDGTYRQEINRLKVKKMLRGNGFEIIQDVRQLL